MANIVGAEATGEHGSKRRLEVLCVRVKPVLTTKFIFFLSFLRIFEAPSFSAQMIIVHTKPLILEENGRKYTIFQVLALLMLSKVGLKKLLSHSFSFLWCKHLQSVFMKLCLCLNIRIGILLYRC